MVAVCERAEEETAQGSEALVTITLRTDDPEPLCSVLTEESLHGTPMPHSSLSSQGACVRTTCHNLEAVASG